MTSERAEVAAGAMLISNGRWKGAGATVAPSRGACASSARWARGSGQPDATLVA